MTSAVASAVAGADATRRRWAGAAAALTLLAVVASGCAGGGGTDDGDGAAAGGEEGGEQAAGDLTMTVWTADEDVVATYQDIADAFREDNPGLGDLTLQSVPFDNYVGRLTTQLSGGDPPDLGWLLVDDVPALAEAGVLYDVGTRLREDEDFAYDDVLPNVRAGFERGEGVYGYPFANTTQPIVFNADAFAKAGVDSPLELYERGEWTWDNLARVAREVVDAGAVTYGFDIPQFQFGSTYTLLTTFLNAYGAEAWPGGTECGYDSPESVEAMTFFHRMVFEDQSYPAPGQTSNFPTGDTAMYLGPPSTLNALSDATFAFDLVPQPEGTAGFNPFFGQAGLVVFANAPNPGLAADFLAFVSNEENSQTLARFYIPGRQALLTGEVVAASNPNLTPESAERAFVEPLPEAEQLAFPLGLPELNEAIQPVMDGLWQPDADVEAVLGEVCAAAEPVLESQG